MEQETKNTAKAGDWVLARIAEDGSPAEQYILTDEKFKKFYFQDPIKDGIDGYKVYAIKPETRTGLVWKDEYSEDNDYVYSQSQIKVLVLDYKDKFQKVMKCNPTYARPAVEGEEIITMVKVNKAEPSLLFYATWDEIMMVKENDVLIILEDEVYRIARAEFNLTYKII